MAKKKGNNYIIDEENNIAKIELKRMEGKESLWTIVDLCDLQRVLDFPYTWFPSIRSDNKRYYVKATVYVEHTTTLLHQFIMNAMGKDVDHINGNSLDNRRENLRVIQHKNNSMNRRSRNSNNKSGHRNVCWNKAEMNWVVQLQINGRNTILARFPKEQLEEAGKFAEQMRRKHYKEFAGKG